MTEMFSTLGTWNWLIFGLILMALELLAPGVFLFWLGLAALLVGLLSFAFHPSWQMQILMFAVFAAARCRCGGASRAAIRRSARAIRFSTSAPMRWSAGCSRWKSRSSTARGTVRIDDTIWRVAGPDAPAGSRVRIVQADGASLTVAAA